MFPLPKNENFPGMKLTSGMPSCKIVVENARFADSLLTLSCVISEEQV